MSELDAINIEKEESVAQFNAQVEAEAKALGLIPGDEVVEDTKPETVVETKVERTFTEVEREQMELGWDPDKPNGVSAEEFKRVGQIIEAKRAASKKAEAANKEVNELTKTVKQLVEHNKKLEKAAYEKALKELEENRRQRILEADIDAVERLDLEREVIQKAVESVDKIEAPQPAQEFSEDTKAYQERNSFWLHGTGPEERKMQALTKNVINYLQEVEPNISEKEAIATIEAELKAKFPHKFENELKDKPAAVLSQKPKSSEPAAQLSAEERQTFLMIQKADPSFTLKEYVQQLELVGRRS